MPIYIPDATFTTALPGTFRQVAASTGISDKAVRRRLRMLHATHQIHIGAWYRPAKGAICEVYHFGQGEDAKCHIKPLTDRQRSQRYYRKLRNTGEMEFFNARRSARDRANRATKKPQSWLSALGL